MQWLNVWCISVKGQINGYFRLIEFIFIKVHSKYHHHSLIAMQLVYLLIVKWPVWCSNGRPRIFFVFDFIHFVGIFNMDSNNSRILLCYSQNNFGLIDDAMWHTYMIHILCPLYINRVCFLAMCFSSSSFVCLFFLLLRQLHFSSGFLLSLTRLKACFFLYKTTQTTKGCCFPPIKQKEEKKKRKILSRSLFQSWRVRWLNFWVLF